MKTNNTNPEKKQETATKKEFTMDLAYFEEIGKKLGISGKTQLEPFMTERLRELNLVKTVFEECLTAFECKMQAERLKVEELIKSLEDKQEEIREKAEYLNSRLPQLRKVYTMTEIKEEKRREIQHAVIDREIKFINDIRLSMDGQLTELHTLKLNQTFVNARKDFEDDTQTFAQDLLNTMEQIKAFQLGFAAGKGIYDDIQAINQTPPPPPGSGPGSNGSGSGGGNGSAHIHANGNGVSNPGH